MEYQFKNIRPTIFLCCLTGLLLLLYLTFGIDFTTNCLFYRFGLALAMLMTCMMSWVAAIGFTLLLGWSVDLLIVTIIPFMAVSFGLAPMLFLVIKE